MTSRLWTMDHGSSRFKKGVSVAGYSEVVPNLLTSALLCISIWQKILLWSPVNYRFSQQLRHYFAKHVHCLQGACNSPPFLVEKIESQLSVVIRSSLTSRFKALKTLWFSVVIRSSLTSRFKALKTLWFYKNISMFILLGETFKS